MSNLIKNELTKIFKKKTIYITMILIFLLMIFINCINKYSNSSSYSVSFSVPMYSESYINSLKEELSNLNPEKPSDVTLYINIKSELDLYNIMEKYKDSDWKLSIINNRISPYITEINTYTYGADKSEELSKKATEEMENIIAKLDENNWKYFANEDLQNAKNKIEELNKQKAQTQDTEIIKGLNNEIENAKVEKEIAEYRLKKNIPYGVDYLNIALTRYQTSSGTLISYDLENKELDFEEQKEYNDALTTKEESKYIIETGTDINKSDSLKGSLQYFYSQYGVFIIVVIIMIAGTIVSEEFNKGTIKLLLVKPYTRNQMLLSKFLTVLIISAFVIVSTILMQILVGGILFGFGSIFEPVVVYNLSTNAIQEINIFAYLGIQTLTQLPIIILLATLAFAISTIFSNSALAITVSLLGYMGAAMINQLAMAYNLTFMKYFVTMNWDLSQYLFGGLPYMEGMNLITSIIICVIYLLIMLIPTFIIFKKRNIKNI